MKPTKAEVANASEFLRSAGWLSGTAADFQKEILSGCHWQWFAGGEAISHGGDTAGGMFGLAQGCLSAMPTLGVPDAPLIHIASAPFWYGANPLVSAAPRSMSAIARTQCLVARVPLHVLALILDADPRRWQFIAKHITDIVNLSQLIACDLQIRDSRRRCLATLLRVANCRAGEASAGTAELNQDELAAMANLSRQTTGKILRKFAEEKLLTVSYRNIVVHDAAALRAVVEL